MVLIMSRVAGYTARQQGQVRPGHIDCQPNRSDSKGSAVLAEELPGWRAGERSCKQHSADSCHK